VVSVATSIGWATKTWNFFTGCSPISSGCAHCWARGFIDRGIVRYDFTPQFHPERLVQPQQWKRPQRVGVCLMSDEAMPVEHYQRRSMDLLHLLAGKPAALYVTETHHFDGRQSKGVATEITAAEDLGIPVVYTMSDLMRLKEAW